MNGSQNQIILQRLQAGRTLTSLDALNDPELRCFRLASRISDLKKAGHPIEKMTVETNTGKRISAYRLKWKGELF